MCSTHGNVAAEITMIEQSTVAAVSRTEAPRPELAGAGAPRIRLLMRVFRLSLSDVTNGSGRSISRSQLHRILRGQQATPIEMRAIALGISTCLREHCQDSAFLFAE